MPYSEGYFHNITWVGGGGTASSLISLVVYRDTGFDSTRPMIFPYKYNTSTPMNQGSDTRPNNIAFYPIIRY